MVDPIYRAEVLELALGYHGDEETLSCAQTYAEFIEEETDADNRLRVLKMIVHRLEEPDYSAKTAVTTAREYMDFVNGKRLPPNLQVMFGRASGPASP